MRTARSVLLVAVLALAVGAALGGCAARTSAVPAAAAGRDTLRGTVQVVGNEPGTVTLTATDAAARPIAVLVDADAALRAAAGLEVMVRGVRRGPSDALPVPTVAFAVGSFSVRAVDGTAAVDGVLGRDGTRLTLRLADGSRVTLAAPPTALQELVGARIYWAGPFDRPPRAYGLLAH